MVGTTDPWTRESHSGYSYFYQSADLPVKEEYARMITQGIADVEAFTHQNFLKSFDVYVHPTRQSWDKKLQEAYQMPDFKSECWMVASGDGFQLNMISPVTWDTAACEHSYKDKTKTRQLLTHELYHVYHGQRNASPDFSDLQGLDWLAEGFATFASGQLTEERKADIRKLVGENAAPTLLDDFWKGKHRYGLSGSMVQYIDSRYGRETLLGLLAFNRKQQVMDALKLTEPELISNWKQYVLKGN